jgi:hypothetical protein
VLVDKRRLQADHSFILSDCVARQTMWRKKKRALKKLDAVRSETMMKGKFLLPRQLSLLGKSIAENNGSRLAKVSSTHGSTSR